MIEQVSLRDFQSVIQLGAALNLGFSALEIVSKGPLLLLSRSHRTALRKAQALGGLRLASDDLIIAIDRSERAHLATKRFTNFLAAVNPYLCVVCGVICLFLLIRSSGADCCEHIGKKAEVILIIICFGWVAMNFVVQLAIRGWLEFLIYLTKMAARDSNEE